MICFCGKTALYRASTQGFCKEHREHAVKGMTYMVHKLDNLTIGIDQAKNDKDADLKAQAKRSSFNKTRKPKNRNL
jgi:hypothetical protein